MPNEIELKLLLDGKEHNVSLQEADQLYKKLYASAVKAFNESKKGSKQVEGSIGALNTRLARVNSLLERSKVGSTRFNSLATEAARLKHEIALAESQIESFGDEVNGVGDNLSNWGNIVTGFNQGLEIAGKALNVLSKPLNIAGEFEDAKVQLSVLLGTMDAAEKRIDELSQFSATTPFEFPQIVKASKVLQVFGGDVLAVGDNLTMIGDVSAGTSQPIEELALHFGRLYDSIQSGRPAGEALMRLQEIGALTGAARAEIEKAIATNMDAADAWEIVTNSMNKFDGMMEQQSATFNGMVSNMQDGITILLRDVGDEILPIAKDIMEVLIPAIGSVSDNMDTVVSIVKVVAVTTAAWAVAIYGAEAALKAKAIAAALASKATSVLNKVMSMNPALAFVAAVTTVIIVLREFTDVFDTATDSLLKSIETQEKDISSQEKLLAAKKQNIEQSKKEAAAHGATREELEEYDKQLQQVIESEKELAKTRAMLEVQKAAAEYVETIEDQASGFLKSIPLIGGFANDIVKMFDSTEKRLADARLKALTDFSTSVEAKILYVKELMKTATAEQLVGLREVYASLLNLQSTDIPESVTVQTKTVTDDDKDKEAEKLEEKRQQVISSKIETSEEKTIIETFKIQVEGETEAEAVRQQIEAEEENFNNILAKLASIRTKDLTEEQIKQYENELDLSQKQIDLLRSRYQAITTEDEKLNQKKEEFFQEYKDRMTQEELDQEVKLMTYQQVNDAIVAEEQNQLDILAQMRAAETQEEFNSLQQTLTASEQREKALRSQTKTIQATVKQNILAYMNQYDAEKSLLENTLNSVRSAIKAKISEAVATQIAKVIASIPFPLNIAAAAAAGLALEALFDKAVPEFGRGEVDIDGKSHRQGGRLVNVEGGESIITREGTDKNKELLKLINQGEQFSVQDKNAVNLSRFVSLSPSSHTSSNVYQMEHLQRSISDMSRSLGKKLDAVVANSGINFNYSDFDAGYQDYLKSLGYIKV